MKLAGLALPLALCLALLSACVTAPKVKPAPPPPVPQNYFSQPEQGQAMRRVAVLPLYSARVSNEALLDVTAAFHSELTKKALFEVVPVSPFDLEGICGQRQLSSVEPLPADLLGKLRQQYGAEGVLLLDITHFNSYRPVAIGVRAKLVDIATGQIRWAFDYVYDAGNPSVADAAKKFQMQYADQRRAIPDDGGTILLSPARFAKYVAAQAFASLKNGH